MTTNINYQRMNLDKEASKIALRKQSAAQRQQLRDEVTLFSERTEKVITNALIIGGALALTYIIVRQFTGGKPRKSATKKLKIVTEPQEAVTVAAAQEPPSIVSQLGNVLVSQASILLLNLAKEKIAAYLQAQKEQKP